MARVDISSQQLQGYLQRVRELKTPPELRANIRVAPKTPIDVPSVSTIQPRELKLHPETPTSETLPSALEQIASNFMVLMTLFPQGRELIAQASQEQKLLGAVA
ncbi:MAG: hypothetical protein ACPL4K_02755 [Candidatus Margulisiibacteriota bacterium]